MFCCFYFSFTVGGRIMQRRLTQTPNKKSTVTAPPPPQQRQQQQQPRRRRTAARAVSIAMPSELPHRRRDSLDSVQKIAKRRFSVGRPRKHKPQKPKKKNGDSDSDSDDDDNKKEKFTTIKCGLKSIMLPAKLSRKDRKSLTTADRERRAEQA